jgi:hypothetical protein
MSHKGVPVAAKLAIVIAGVTLPCHPEVHSVATAK